METRKLISSLIFAGGLILWAGGSSLLAQQVRSETTRFHLNNLQKEETDSLPPVITLDVPRLVPGEVFVTDKESLPVIGRVDDRSRVLYVTVNRYTPPINAEGVFNTELTLEAGENEVSIRSIDEHNNLYQQVYTVRYDPPVITLADRIRMESTYYGLIIGVNEYESPDMVDLDHPLSDAKKLYRVLTEEYGFDKENIFQLRNPTRNEIIAELSAIRGIVKESDNLLIFYAGHGYHDEVADIGYWLPSDAARGNPANWFENTTLVNQLKGVKARHILLISDACFAGSIFRSRAMNMNMETSYENIYEERSRRAMVSSSNLEEVPDESAFIKYLLESLEENRQPYFSAQDLFSKVYEACMSAGTKVPGYGDIQSLDSRGGHFIFLRQDAEY